MSGGTGRALAVRRLAVRGAPELRPFCTFAWGAGCQHERVGVGGPRHYCERLDGHAKCHRCTCGETRAKEAT